MFMVFVIINIQMFEYLNKVKLYFINIQGRRDLFFFYN